MKSLSSDSSVVPDSDTARFLGAAAAAAEPIRVDVGEKVYRVAVYAETECTLPRPPREDIAASIAGTSAAAGSWVGLIDAEAFAAYCHQRRRARSPAAFTGARNAKHLARGTK